MDGQTYTSATTFHWVPGSAHQMSASARVRFNGQTWGLNGSTSTEGEIIRSLITPSEAVTQTFVYLSRGNLTWESMPALGGTIEITPAPVNGQVPIDTVVTATVQPAPGYTFRGWGGSASGTATTTQFTATPNAFGHHVVARFTGTGASVQAGAQTFVPLPPCRLFDGTVAGTSTVPIAGQCGIPATATAYAMTISVTPDGPLAYLTAWPAGDTRPLVSTLNAFDGQPTANAAIIPAGAGGAISVFVTSATRVTVDTSGYFVDSSGGLWFYPLTPCRIIDSRSGAALTGVRNLAVLASPCGVPAVAQALSVNVTAVPGGALHSLRIYPAGANPIGAAVQSPLGQIRANAQIVKLGDGSAVNVDSTQTTDFVVDVNGYFAPLGAAPNGLRFYRLTPCRVADTRHGEGLNGPFGPPTIAAAGTRTIPVLSGRCGVPTTARAYAVNVTVVPPAGLAYLTLWPADQARPLVSTLNAFEGQILANAAIVPSGPNGDISVFAANPTDVIVDVNGYFAP